MQTTYNQDLDKIFNDIVRTVAARIHFAHNECEVEEAEFQARIELRKYWKDDLLKNLSSDTTWKVRGIIVELTNTIEWQTWLHLEPYVTEH